MLCFCASLCLRNLVLSCLSMHMLKRFSEISRMRMIVLEKQYLRNRSAPAVNCWVISHCLEVICKEDQITSAQREIYLRTTDLQTVNYYSTIHALELIYFDSNTNKRRKHIRSLQLLPTFRHCTEELPPILRLRRIRLHVIVTSFKRKNDVTSSNAMNDVIFGWRQLSHT